MDTIPARAGSLSFGYVNILFEYCSVKRNQVECRLASSSSCKNIRSDTGVAVLTNRTGTLYSGSKRSTVPSSDVCRLAHVQNNWSFPKFRTRRLKSDSWKAQPLCSSGVDKHG